MQLLRAVAGFPYLAKVSAPAAKGLGAVVGLWAALPRNGMVDAKGLGRVGPGHVLVPDLRLVLGRGAATADFAVAESVGPRLFAAAHRGCS